MGPSLASGTPTSTTHEPRFWAPPEHPNLASAHAHTHNFNYNSTTGGSKGSSYAFDYKRYNQVFAII